MNIPDRDGAGERDAREAKVERYLQGELAPDEQRAFEMEILEDGPLAGRVYEEASLDVTFADATQARRSRRTSAITRGRRKWLPLALAALALFIVFVTRDQDPSVDETPPRLRSDDTEFRGVFPRGEVSDTAIRFEWTPDALAVAYRLEVLDETGRLVHEAESADTTLVVPLASLGDGFRSGSWRAVPRDDLGLERPATPSAAFRIVER